MQRSRPLLASILIVAAAISWWMAEQQDEAVGPIAHKGPREVDYYITGLDVTRMTIAGEPAHRLQAKHLQHFSDDETTELQRPHLTVFQAEAPPWEVDSERAWMSADGSLVLLTGEVLIERAGDANNRPMRIETRNLRVQPREDYAETDEKVRVESDSDWLDAVGMQAWLRPPSRLKFLSQVKGHHVPR